MSLSFGFSKVKPKTTLTQTSAIRTLDSDSKKSSDEPKAELITSIEGRKVTSLNKPDESSGALNKKTLVIPCKKNTIVFDLNKIEDALKGKSSSSVDDMEAVRALILESKAAKGEKKESDLKIPLKSDEAQKELEKVEEPDYESVDLEHFGKYFNVNYVY